MAVTEGQWTYSFTREEAGKAQEGLAKYAAKKEAPDDDDLAALRRDPSFALIWQRKANRSDDELLRFWARFGESSARELDEVFTVRESDLAAATMDTMEGMSALCFRQWVQHTHPDLKVDELTLDQCKQVMITSLEKVLRE